MKYGYREVRRMSVWTLRRFCLENDLYTCGNRKEYENMLDMASSKEHLTTDDIIELAADIFEHSDRECEYMATCTFADLCNGLINITKSRIVKA